MLALVVQTDAYLRLGDYDCSFLLLLLAPLSTGLEGLTSRLKVLHEPLGQPYVIQRHKLLIFLEVLKAAFMGA